MTQSEGELKSRISLGSRPGLTRVRCVGSWRAPASGSRREKRRDRIRAHGL